MLLLCFYDDLSLYIPIYLNYIEKWDLCLYVSVARYLPCLELPSNPFANP